MAPLTPNCRTWVQGLFVIFVLSASVSVLLMIIDTSDQEVCDYTGVVESCDLQPVYRTDAEREFALLQFHHLWLGRAQDLRNISEKQKCTHEDRLMADLAAMHRREALTIIQKCHANFQRCVDDLKREAAWITTTVTTTTTEFVYVAPTTKSNKPPCLRDSKNTGGYLDCITNQNNAAPAPSVDPQAAALAAQKPRQDCSRCDSFCRSYNWTQLNPDYAAAMNFTTWTCGAKVCPWIPECGLPGGENIHKNCSVQGCPCERATCPGYSAAPAPASGGRLRRMAAHAAAPPTPAPPPTTTSFVPYTTTTTYEDLENATNCTCKPGFVDTVIVGRPHKVFYGDPATMIRRRRSAPNATAGGRRLFADGGRLYLEEDGERRLFDMHHLSIEELQGVHIDMEEEILVHRIREFSCRTTFSDRYKYVYPKTVGDIHSMEALLARQSHPDLGCGYSGNYRVMCMPVLDNETGDDTGNCSYQVDISTCVPPSYEKALDECYVEEAYAPDVTIVPTIAPFLEVEDLNLSYVREEPDLVTVTEAPDAERCCQAHVGTECVPGRDSGHGSVDGIWQADLSYKRQTGYFPRVYCSKQASLHQHACPRVKIKELPSKYQADLTPECYRVCNLSSVNEEFQRVCDSKVFPDTKAREEEALKDKINVMERNRAELDRWSRANWPLVLGTKHVHDCIEESRWSRRWNMLGFAHDERGGFEKLKLKYGCRLHGCKINECLQVQTRCPIPLMANAPETTCGPFGEQAVYKCVPKVRFKTENELTGLMGLCWLGASFCCLLGSIGACIKGTCFQKASRVYPDYLDEELEESDELAEARAQAIEDAKEESNQVCEACGRAVGEGEQYCKSCRANRPTVCEKCGASFEDDDNVCSACGEPRPPPPKALADVNQVDYLTDGPSQNPEDAIVVRAPTSPASGSALRATAQSANNERRIVPVDRSSNVPPEVMGAE